MKLFILGCGALGSNIAMNLAFDRRDDMQVLIDFDKIEARNYRAGTQQFFPEQEGMSKVGALQFNLYKIARKLNVVFLDKKFSSLRDLEPLEKDDLLIDCFDNYEARDLIRRIAKAREMECVHVGFSPKMTFEICWNDSYETPETMEGGFDICEANGARSFLQYVTGLATNVVTEYLEKGVKVNLVGNKFSIQKIE